MRNRNNDAKVVVTMVNGEHDHGLLSALERRNVSDIFSVASSLAGGSFMIVDCIEGSLSMEAFRVSAGFQLVLLGRLDLAVSGLRSVLLRLSSSWAVVWLESAWKGFASSPILLAPVLLSRRFMSSVVVGSSPSLSADEPDDRLRIYVAVTTVQLRRDSSVAGTESIEGGEIVFAQGLQGGRSKCFTHVLV